MTTDQPSDDEMLAGLRRARQEQWFELRRLVEIVEHEPATTSWGGGPMPTADDDDERPRIIQWPYPVYTESVNALEQLLYAMNAVVAFPWPDWHADRTFTPDGVRAGSAADAVRLVTSVIRGERFCDGAIGACITDGTLPAAIHRLLDWYDSRQP